MTDYQGIKFKIRAYAKRSGNTYTDDNFVFEFNPPPSRIEINPTVENRIRPRRNNYSRVRFRFRPNDNITIRGILPKTEAWKLWGLYVYGSDWLKSGFQYREGASYDGSGTEFVKTKWRIETPLVDSSGIELFESGVIPDGSHIQYGARDEYYAVIERMQLVIEEGRSIDNKNLDPVTNQPIGKEPVYAYVIVFRRVRLQN